MQHTQRHTSQWSLATGQTQERAQIHDTAEVSNSTQQHKQHGLLSLVALNIPSTHWTPAAAAVEQITEQGA
jgi:hypothetical protein